MKKYTSAVILVLISVLFTYLEVSRPDPDEARFWELAARFALFAGLLKAFLIREDEEYAHQLRRIGDKLDILCEDHGRFQRLLMPEPDTVEMPEGDELMDMPTADQTSALNETKTP